MFKKKEQKEPLDIKEDVKIGDIVFAPYLSRDIWEKYGKRIECNPRDFGDIIKSVQKIKIIEIRHSVYSEVYFKFLEAGELYSINSAFCFFDEKEAKDAIFNHNLRILYGLVGRVKYLEDTIRKISNVIKF